MAKHDKDFNPQQTALHLLAWTRSPRKSKGRRTGSGRQHKNDGQDDHKGNSGSPGLITARSRLDDRAAHR